MTSSRSASRRVSTAAAFALLAGGVGLGVTSLAPSAGAATGSGLRFGHEVQIDQQRSGFEPDVVVDSKNHIYSSVPNGSLQAHSFIWSSLDGGDSFQLTPG